MSKYSTSHWIALGVSPGFVQKNICFLKTLFHCGIHLTFRRRLTNGSSAGRPCNICFFQMGPKYFEPERIKAGNNYVGWDNEIISGTGNIISELNHLTIHKHLWSCDWKRMPGYLACALFYRSVTSTMNLLLDIENKLKIKITQKLLQHALLHLYKTLFVNEFVHFIWRDCNYHKS